MSEHGSPRWQFWIDRGGTFTDIVAKLHDAVVKAVNTPGVRDKLVAAGSDPLTMTPDEFTRFLRADIEKWDKVVKAAGVKMEQ